MSGGGGSAFGPEEIFVMKLSKDVLGSSDLGPGDIWKDIWQMSRNVKWAGVELAIFSMIQIQQNYTSLYSSWSNI